MPERGDQYRIGGNVYEVGTSPRPDVFTMLRVELSEQTVRELDQFAKDNCRDTEEYRANFHASTFEVDDDALAPSRLRALEFVRAECKQPESLR